MEVFSISLSTSLRCRLFLWGFGAQGFGAWGFGAWGFCARLFWLAGFLAIFDFPLRSDPFLVALGGWHTSPWPEEFFGDLSSVFVWLGRCVPCGACSAWIVIFQWFWEYWKGSLPIPLPLPQSHICWIFLTFSFQGVPWESYSLFSLIIYWIFPPRLGELEQVSFCWVILRLFWWAGRLSILGRLVVRWYLLCHPSCVPNLRMRLFHCIQR